METLITQFTVQETLLFLVVFGLALKGVIDFFDWGHTRLRKIFDKEYKNRITTEEFERKLNENYDRIKELESDHEASMEKLTKLHDKLDLLIESDKDDIKSFITREHHYFCYQRGWIDDYSLECCERRYAHYQAEGGNNFIKGFMVELRNLPKTAPDNIDNSRIEHTTRIVNKNYDS